MSILPITNQSIANPWPIKCRSLVNSHNSMPIYNQFNRLPIRQFNANPLPILQRSANPSPIQKHNAHIGPIHQSITKSTIRSQSQTNLLNNPSPIHHSNANPPRHYQPINANPQEDCQSWTNSPIKCQSLTKSPIQCRSITDPPILANHEQISQFNASPGPIHHQNTKSLSILDLSTSQSLTNL